MSGVLVTGATTPIGEALVWRLAREQRERRILAVGIEPPERAPAFPENVTYASADLSRSRDLRRLLFGPARDLALDAVVHTAFHRSAAHGEAGHRLNVEATRELLHLCDRHPTIRRFVLRSFAEVYRTDAHEPVVIDEEQPLDLSPHAPAWIRDRVEADLVACTRMGMSPLHIVVLRAAECVAPGVGSQLHDYLQPRVCLTPLGFDPMLHLLSIPDLVRALALAVETPRQGVFNVPGKDILPLSAAIRAQGRIALGVPGPMLSPLYALRRAARGGAEFRYDLNKIRLHFGAVLDGERARSALGFVPEHALVWPV